ncbi:hypothetical protein ACO1O0_001132 [Amphichorda felina]
MSLFSCPNASRSLLRVAARGLSSSSSSTTTTTSRLLSTCTSRTRSMTPSHARTALRPIPATPRYAVFTTTTCGQRRTFFRPAIIRDYVDLPRDYKDRTGLPFRQKDLSPAEVERIFGGDMQPASANHLLRILHGRRVAGTLDDPAFAVHTAQYPEDQVARALAYLRGSVKVDEVINAGLRAEDELSQMEVDPRQEEEEEEGYTGRGTKEREVASAGETAEPVEYKPDPIYGRSRFDEIRARNQAKEKARQRALEEERKAAEAEGRIVPESEDDPRSRSLVEVDEGQRAITNPKIAEYYKEASSDMKEPPRMTMRERVGPSLVVFLLGVGFLASLAMVYNEPSDRYRLLPEVSTGVATVGAMVGLNLLVFALWRVPPLWKALNRYMIFVVGKPRPLTLFTANFSHQEFKHLAINMAILALGGVHLHEDLGRLGFLTMFLGCGAAGFLSGLVTYSARGMLGITSLGASGAVMGVLGAYYWDHRDDRFRVFGLPQEGVHGIVWWALLVGFSVFEAFSTFAVKNRTDVVGHVAGLVSGMLGIELMNWAGLGRKRKTGEDGTDAVMVKDLASGESTEARQEKR